MEEERKEKFKEEILLFAEDIPDDLAEDDSLHNWQKLSDEIQDVTILHSLKRSKSQNTQFQQWLTDRESKKQSGDVALVVLECAPFKNMTRCLRDIARTLPRARVLEISNNRVVQARLEVRFPDHIFNDSPEANELATEIERRLTVAMNKASGVAYGMIEKPSETEFDKKDEFMVPFKFVADYSYPDCGAGGYGGGDAKKPPYPNTRNMACAVPASMILRLFRAVSLLDGEFRKREKEAGSFGGDGGAAAAMSEQERKHFHENWCNIKVAQVYDFYC